MKRSHSCLRWNKNVQSRFAVLHFGDGRLHEVFEGPHGVFEGGAYFRRRAGDALHQRRVQRDHLSPHVPVHWQEEEEERNEQKPGTCLRGIKALSRVGNRIFSPSNNTFARLYFMQMLLWLLSNNLNVEGQTRLTVLWLSLFQGIHESADGFQHKDDLSHLLPSVKKKRWETLRIKCCAV